MARPALLTGRFAVRRHTALADLLDRRPLRAAAVFVASFVVAYVLVVAPAFDEALLVNRLAFDGSIVLAIAAAMAPAALLPVGARRPSDAGLWVLYLAGYVPSVLVPPFLLGAGWSLGPTWLVLAASFALIVAVVRSVDLEIPCPPIGVATYGAILAALALLGIVLMVAWFGIPRTIPSLGETAVAREDFRDALSEAGRAAGYAVWWTGSVVAPLLLAFGTWRRSRLLVILGVLSLGLVYATTAFRSTAFALLLIVVVMALVAHRRRSFGRALATAATGLIASAGLLALAGWLVPASLLVRRLFVVPGQVFAYYQDFFAAGEHYALSHSLLSWLLPRPYPQSPPELIGQRYFGDPAIHANGNLWADGIANFGLAGVVGASLVLVLALVALDAAARGKPALVAIPVGALAVWSVTNSGVLTSLLTHGLAPTILLLWVLPAARRRRPVSERFGAVHLTSVHRAADPRIYLKECATLAARGISVTLVARGDAPAPIPGVGFVSVEDVRGRLARMAVVPLRILRVARRLRARVYHFHDPELIPVGLVLKGLGARVVYDAHEDLPRQVAYKPYLPGVVKPLISRAAEFVEQLAVRALDAVVAATPRIAQRFPDRKTVLVQNFPLPSEFVDGGVTPYADRVPHVVYLGRLTTAIGALEMAEAASLVARQRSTRFTFAGPADAGLADEVRRRAEPAVVELPGWLDRSAALALLGSATVGLVVFQPEANYVEAYPTKLFEYMASAVPVVASDFPLWRDIVLGSESGLVVDPARPAAIAAAIVALLDDPVVAMEMGRRGRRTVQAKYSWDTQADRLIALYDRLGAAGRTTDRQGAAPLLDGRG